MRTHENNKHVMSIQKDVNGDSLPLTDIQNLHWIVSDNRDPWIGGRRYSEEEAEYSREVSKLWRNIYAAIAQEEPSLIDTMKSAGETLKTLRSGEKQKADLPKPTTPE